MGCLFGQGVDGREVEGGLGPSVTHAGPWGGPIEWVGGVGEMGRRPLCASSELATAVCSAYAIVIPFPINERLGHN